MISFQPFFDKLYLDEISTYKLIKEHHISSSTINRLKHNKPVSTATIEKLCEVLNCEVYDILEFKPDKKNWVGAAYQTLIFSNLLTVYSTS